MQAPDAFRAGVSIAPATDWRLYDTHYTERYMGHPGANVEGYKQSSVLTYARNLKGKLLLVHGISGKPIRIHLFEMVLAHFRRYLC